MKYFKIILFLLVSFEVYSQTNIRAWYAKGQVWIVWKTKTPYPESFGIYKSDNTFSQINQATPIGRLFYYEYLPGTFIQQTGDPNFTYTVPKGDSTYTLAPGEALFVETVTSSGAAYYGVVEWGKSNLVAGENLTQAAVNFNFNPILEPVTCHLQWEDRLNTGHKTKWFGMWLLGRLNENSGRPDFPVMANAFKNGMPSMFIVSESLKMDTSQGKKIPLTHWLHGGGGSAIQHVANKMPFIGLAPESGITASHNDDCPQKFILDGDTVLSAARTQWFGWTRNHNPFNPLFDAGPGDTIINYTQRRIMWVNNWLIRYYNVDEDRVALQGYSMGSGGVSALGKAFPNSFSTICAFNNGFRRVNEESISGILGTVEENLPTNLTDANNQSVHINEVMDMNTSISNSRDFPLFRTWAGKNDPNDRMHWGPDLVMQYRIADSIGMGHQIYWDERAHTYPSLGFHWIEDNAANKQTYKDNLRFQELFNSKQSFPAFFNHRLEKKNHDPGSGDIGINKGDGDNWGTWGGYHNWDLKQMKDQKDSWSVIAWLESNALFDNDNCPVISLKADVAIRKPQQFKPISGKLLNWFVKDIATGIVLQNGITIVRANGLVVIPQVEVFKEDVRKVEISIVDPTVRIDNTYNYKHSQIKIEPNPSSSETTLKIILPNDIIGNINIAGLERSIYSMQKNFSGGENVFSLSEFQHLPVGFYFITVQASGVNLKTIWLKSQ